ncbi:heme ABC transporter ATP-binding protein [Sinorhizobium fredii USDA 205]|nr:ABC transporter ATP-binding protein [Sinorhizobium fredii CCBAU 83666]KSV91496.1 heme ABC transporter ATP-binding protein [Sinorhizobium fredii USDA 205]GEC35662.1 ABC transporter ATP-binding protein [Sinorhizobium fredii]GLS10215.1 ABC transporter ATP-binding protein [Sinorhizobium fredii]
MPDEELPFAGSAHSLPWTGKEASPATPLPVTDVSSNPALRLSRISKRFGPLKANEAISFDLKRGEVIALLGENGAGKTTLMNILFGHYVADEGSVEAFGEPLPPGDPRAALDAGIGMVHQHFTLADNMTVQENIALGTQSLWRMRLDRAAAQRRIEQLSADFGLAVDPAATVSTLSVGERQRVEILKALYREARILILDEPTAVLTPAETDALFRTLKLLVAKGLSIIFISHKLHEVMAVSDRVLVLRSGYLVGERETGSTDRKELAALMVGQEVKPAEVSPVKLGAPLLALEGVSTAPYNGAGLDKVSLTLTAGEITGLAGVAGNGQAVLAGLIAGIRRPTSGSISIAGREVADWSPRAALAHGVARIPEDRHAIGSIGDMSVTENVIAERYRSPRFSRMGFLNWKAAGRFAEKLIADYDVKCPSPEARIRLLSGGNMQKLILGRALDPDPAVILASQPTRGLDVGAVAYVHRMLLEARDRGAAILLISEDLEEVLALSDRIIVMSKGRFSTPSSRGERTIRELGDLMAGHSGEHSDHAA